MRNLLKVGVLAFALGLMFISANTVNAQSWGRERKARREYREDIRDARQDYRRDVRNGRSRREAVREFREDRRDAIRDYRRDTNRRSYNRGYYQNYNRGYYPYYNNNRRYNTRGYTRNGIFIRIP